MMYACIARLLNTSLCFILKRFFCYSSVYFILLFFLAGGVICYKKQIYKTTELQVDLWVLSTFE